jgi:hypothetical protein
MQHVVDRREVGAHARERLPSSILRGGRDSNAQTGAGPQSPRSSIADVRTRNTRDAAVMVHRIDASGSAAFQRAAYGRTAGATLASRSVYAGDVGTQCVRRARCRAGVFRVQHIARVSGRRLSCRIRVRRRIWPPILRTRMQGEGLPERPGVSIERGTVASRALRHLRIGMQNGRGLSRRVHLRRVAGGVQLLNEPRLWSRPGVRKWRLLLRNRPGVPERTGLPAGRELRMGVVRSPVP